MVSTVYLTIGYCSYSPASTTCMTLPEFHLERGGAGGSFPPSQKKRKREGKESKREREGLGGGGGGRGSLSI